MFELTKIEKKKKYIEFTQNSRISKKSESFYFL